MTLLISKENIYGREIVCFDDYIYKNSISINKMWENEICNEIFDNLKEGTDFIDIGANIGYVTLGVNKLIENSNKKIGNIHCFECDPTTFNLLNKNISQLENVKIYPFAIGDKQSLCLLNDNDYNKGCNHIYRSFNVLGINDYNYEHNNGAIYKKKSNIFVSSLALDQIDYIFTNKISVIKIDIEGYEYLSLLGAKQILDKHRPVIIVEIFEVNFIKTINLLENYNYTNYKKIKKNIHMSDDYIFYPE